MGSEVQRDHAGEYGYPYSLLFQGEVRNHIVHKPRDFELNEYLRTIFFVDVGSVPR